MTTPNTYVFAEIDLSEGTAFLETQVLAGYEAIWKVEVEYTEATSADAAIDAEVVISTLANVSSDSADHTYTTLVSEGIGTVSRNWKDDGNDPDYAGLTEDRISVRCTRNKTGTGAVIITVYTFDLQ